MGFIKVRVGVFNPQSPERVVEMEGVVDAGTIYTVVRRDILHSLGVSPLGRRRFKAFGGYVERDVGEVGLVSDGREARGPGDIRRG
ncbi:MAG: aspartyl protease [Thermoproteus sp.]